jgi:MFS family permease
MSLCWLLLLKMRLSCPKRSIKHFHGSWCPCGYAHFFETSHTSTAFTFSMRSIILFSASQRHPAWDIYAPVVAVAACVAAGFGIGCFMLIEVTLLQERVSEHLLGRVSSLDMFGSFLLLPIGLGVVGWLAERVCPSPIFVVGGLLSLILALLGICV